MTGETRRGPAVVAIALAMIVAGCLGNPARDVDGSEPTATETATPPPTKHPKIDSVYLGLVRASNRSAYAADHGLELVDGRVVALVVLEENRSIPGGFGVRTQSRHENRVQAEVPVDQLVDFAEHGNVSYVRRPPISAVDDTNSRQ